MRFYTIYSGFTGEYSYGIKESDGEHDLVGPISAYYRHSLGFIERHLRTESELFYGAGAENGSELWNLLQNEACSH